MREPLAARSAPGMDMMRAFLHSEAAGGVFLIGATLIALLWSNSADGSSYAALFGTKLHLDLGIWRFDETLGHTVNDGLMALFFLLVGLEIRREILVGELSTPARLAGPAIAAIGGMAVPALVFLALNRDEPANLRGWAVPTATDIAFTLAVLQILGRRAPTSVKVFLTALAIIDDLGAIGVIALFYTRRLDLPALAAAGAVWAVLFVLNRAGVRALLPYLLGGVLLWACVFSSGVHATLAGVALAFVVPMRAADGALPDDNPAHRLEHGLTLWVAYLVLPLFGLANAGLRLDDMPRATLTEPLVFGIFFGLFVGKPVGVFGATWIGRRLGLLRLPPDITAPVLLGAAVLCGIGFTMSLFIGDLAFAGGARDAEVKLAVFAASFVAAVAGVAILLFNLPDAPPSGH